MALVKCSHNMIGKKKFLCNDPVTGAKTFYELEQGVLVWVPEEIAADYRDVFSVIPEQAVESVDEKIDPADDGDIENTVEPVADDGTDNPEKTDEEPPLKDADGNLLAEDPEKSDEDPDPLVEKLEKELEKEEVATVDVINAFDDKEALELYGRKFNVELDRRKSLKNMKKALKKALEL